MELMYTSTRNANEKVTASQAILKGLAEDGGLFVPEQLPTLDKTVDELAGMTYQETAYEVMKKFLTDFTEEELKNCINAAYDSKFDTEEIAVTKKVDGAYYLELFHGATIAFKDMALQIMPRLLSMALRKTGEARTALILVATSGDTGKAALEGYKDVDQVKIMVFYPQDGVSDMQKLQMASQEGDNVNVCAIKGNFDDAQTGVKRIFSDEAIAQELNQKGYFLSSANSINWGRLAPQIVYYVSAYCDLLSAKKITAGQEIDVCVPTGNFGNIFAAYLAKKMGLPIRKLICASNRNNILTDFIRTGIYDRNRPFYTTMSPSMDILISSNLERLLYLLQGPQKTAECMKQLAQTGRYEVSEEIKKLIQQDFEAYFASEEDTAKTIHQVFNQQKYLIDPHTAVALFAAQQSKHEGRITVTASTASPYKFSADVLAALGGKIDTEDFFQIQRELFRISSAPVPAPLSALENKTYRFTVSTGKSAEEMFQQVQAFIQ